MCVGTLVYFVGHMVGRINVDTVIELVSEDLCEAVASLTLSHAPPPAAWTDFGPLAVEVADDRRGYLQEFDRDALADWASAHRTRVQLLVRPGDFVFPGAIIARAEPSIDGLGATISRTTALAGQRVSRAELEYPVRQLVEIAVRALSPGMNDAHTAISVLDRLGATL